MSLVTFPEDLFNSLKCYVCSKYLSVGPIISIANDGIPYKCGRCKDIPSDTIIRNLCYEKVAAFLTFPCSYENCEVKLEWELVGKHEKLCQHRIIQCVQHGCDTLIKVSDFEKHFRLHSEKRVFYDSIEKFVIKKYCSTVLLLKKTEQHFIVVIRYCHGILYAGVYSLQQLTQSTFFELEMSSNMSYSPLIYYKAEINVYDELIHCINCMRQKCHLKYHSYSDNYNKSGVNIDILPLKINFEALEKIFLSPAKIMYSVNILQKINNKICNTRSKSENLQMDISENPVFLNQSEEFEQDIQYLFK